MHSNGIMLLTAVAGLLLVAFQGDTNRLIPLYAVGVFTSFTLSQAGMVVHWWKNREARWHWSIVVNGVGAVTTGVVLLVIAGTKFVHGAWIVIVLVPVLVAYFKWIHASYASVTKRLRITSGVLSADTCGEIEPLHNHVVLLVSTMDKRMVRAIQYAKTLKADSIEAIFVDLTGESGAPMREKWERCDLGIPLTIIDSPYREIIEPIRAYVSGIPRPDVDHAITVIVPEFVPETYVDYMLHDQTAFWIKQTLFRLPGVIIADVPYRMGNE